MNDYWYALSSKIVAMSGSCFVLYHDNISNWWCLFTFIFVAIIKDNEKDKVKKNE